MAEKRMFSNKIIGSDMFLEMPDSTQNLYFHLSMSADDDGFVDKVKTIMRMTGKKEDDLKILVAKSFVIPFDTGIVVIKDWRINNYIRSDRYNETIYLKEKQQLSLTKNKSYELLDTAGIPLVSIDKNRLDKNRLDKNRIDIGEQVAQTTKTNFKKPTLEEVKAYCIERKNSVDAQRFIDFYESKGWMVGKNKMKDWKASVRTWENKDKSKVVVGSQAQFTEKEISKYANR